MAVDKNGRIVHTERSIPIELNGREGAKRMDEYALFSDEAGEGGEIQLEVLVRASNEPNCPGKSVSKNVSVRGNK